MEIETKFEMKAVWAVADNIISPLGKSSEENFASVLEGKSGIEFHPNDKLQWPVGRIKDNAAVKDATRFESLCLEACRSIVQLHNLPIARTVFILSSTKGNIGLLERGHENHPRLGLAETASFIAESLGLKNAYVVSNACISGVMAITIAKRFLVSEKFDHALIVGADELTDFVLSGFQSLQALSNEICRPFDVDRKGINLGEAAASILLSAKPEEIGARKEIRVLGGGLSNDANHISGPSRTGKELASAIEQALNESNLCAEEIDFISAHGTATIYNDEMEAKAFNHAGLTSVPLHSLKNFYGHTLGTAGILETIIGVHSLKNNVVLPMAGFERTGVSEPVTILIQAIEKNIRTFLKTASGFGGCNAALVIQKSI